MNLFKKSFLIFSVVLSLVTTGKVLSTQEDIFEEFNDFLDDNEFEFVKRQLTPGDAIEIFISMKIQELLQENFFLRTQPLTKREIIDLPIAMLDKKYSCDDSILGVEFFWNFTDRSYFSRKCDSIKGYLAISNEDFLEKLVQVSKEIEKLQPFEFDPLDTLSLFDNGTVQQRRFGVLLHGKKSIRNWNFFWHIPFYYLERNYWFTEEEQEKIEERLGTQSEEEQEKFQNEHMISDKFGFGDLRLRFEFPFTENENFSTRIGGFITAPIAWAPAKGLKGSHYKPFIRSSDANLQDITGYHINEIMSMGISDDPEKKKQAAQLMTDLAYKTLDHLSSNILDTPIGNNRHFGFGANFTSRMPIRLFIKRPWAHNLYWQGFLSLEYLLPAIETRYFVDKTDARLFDARDFDDTSKDYENMVFLEQQFINKLFPLAYDTTVYPGIVFRWTGKLVYESKRWGLHLGSDMWIKSKEQLHNICAPKDVMERLKIEEAKRLTGYQSKLFGSLFFKKERRNCNWIFSLNGDATFGHSGIGSDYTMTFKLEVDF